MAKTLADIRAQYPQYDKVDDATLADALYKKYYSHADRREFDARVGLKPYENFGQVAGKALTNLPQTIAGSANSMAVLGAEGVKDILQEPTLDEGVAPVMGPDGKPLPIVSDPISRATRAVVNAVPGANAALTAKADEIAADQLARRKASDATLAANAPDVKPGSLEDYTYQTVQAAADMAAPMTAAILMRNPAPMMAYGSFRSGAEGYQKARDAGLEPDKARLAAGLYAAAEAVTEGVGSKVLLEGGKTLVGAVVKGVFSEGITEGATEALQAAIDAGIIGEEMTLPEAIERIKQAAIVGGLTGAPFAAAGHAGHGAEAVPTEPATPVVDAIEPTVEVGDPVAPENQFALPAPELMLALPSPEQFAAPNTERRHGPAPEASVEAAVRAEQEAVSQAQSAVQRTRQQATKELLATARETIAPLGTFTADELETANSRARQEKFGPDGEMFVRYGDKDPWVRMDHFGDGGRSQMAKSGISPVQRVKTWRMQTGRPIDAPITIEDMARAKVPQTAIDNVIAARRPMTAGEVLSPKDVLATAEGKNIIAGDANFKELAFRTTGARDVNRMNQVQLKALHSTLEAMPVHDKPVTVPVAETSPFTEGQYNKALDALRTQGRFTLKAVKDATGLKTDKDAQAVRDAMVRRGQLTQRSKDDYRLYDVLGTERQTTPADLPKGAFSEHVVKRLPVNKIQVKVDGKSVGSFASGTEARNKIRELRAREAEKGGTPAKIELGQGEEVAYGVMENRYDEKGNLLGQVVVDTARDESAARKLADQRNTPDSGARYTQTTVESTLNPAPAPVRRPPAPEAMAGRAPEIVKSLNALAKQRGLPLLGTKVAIQNDLRTPDGTPVEGVYTNNLIAIAASNLDANMTTNQVVDRLAQVMDHELIHALKQAGVLSPETEGWKTIARYANKAKRPGENETYYEWAKRQYAGMPGYSTTADIEEEAIAEAFRVWAANKRNVTGKPATVFRQLVEWFKRLFSSIPSELFGDIETGKMIRDALTPPGANQPRARAGKEMAEAQAAAKEAVAADDIETAQRQSRNFLRARAQAREDRYGRSGPKTVLGTTPTRAYDAATKIDRAALDAITDRYRERSGVTQSALATYLPEDVAYMERVADAQQKGRHDPEALDVAKAYRSLVTETKDMYDNLGPLAVERYAGDGAPYDSPAAMFADIAEGRLKMRLSDDMFGAGPDNPGHPMNAASGRTATDGTPLTNNDLFRVVHEVYGRGPNGLRSDPRGDYNAYHEHARLVSPEARRALATETLGQSAWHHYGPHLRRGDGTVPRPNDIDYLPPSYKEFAEQKAFLIPEVVIDADRGWALADAAAAAVDDASQVELPRYMLALKDVMGVEKGGLYRGPLTREQMVAMNQAADSGDWVERKLPPLSLTATQPEVNDDFVDSPNRYDPSDAKAKPLVVRVNGVNYVRDGHHRVAAALSKGAEEISVRLIDVDARLAASRPDPNQLELRFSLFDDTLPGGRLYGDPNRSPGGALSKPDTPSPAFTNQRDGDRHFGGEMADEQLRRAIEGTDGTSMIYLTPDEFLALADQRPNPEQGVYDAAIAEGFKFNTLPSLVVDGYAGNVRAPESDGVYAARALAGQADVIPVVLYPKRNESMGLVTALENNGVRVPWPKTGRQENFPEARGTEPKYSLTAPYGERVPMTPPDTANIVDQRIDTWVGKKLHALGRSKTSIGKLPGIFDLRIKFQDKMLSVKEMIENTKALDGKVTDDTDVYMVEQLAGARTVHQIEHRTDKLYEPLFAALEAAGKGKNPVSVKEFEDFLYARHAPERNTYLRSRGSKLASPSGMSDAEAEAILDKMAIDDKYGALLQLAAMADEISKDTTRTRVEAGLITQEAADSSPYENYVPLRGKTEEDLDPEDVYDPQTRARSGKGYTVGGREDRAVTGRERKAGDIVSHLMLQNTEAVIRAEKNKVALSFMRLLQDNPNSGYGSIVKTAPTRRVVGANGVIREAGDPSYRQRPDVFTAKFGGKEIIAQVNDPRVARAMKSDYVSQNGAFINFLGRMNRYLATVNTSWNPEFLISNLARDMQTAGILGAQYDIKGLSGKIIKGAPKAMLGIREVLRDGTTNSPMAKAFKEMQDAGGTTEFLGLHDLDTHVARLRKMAANTGLNPTARQALERVRAIGSFIDDYNTVAENAFRLGAYVAARDAGVSVQKAAFLAKNLTVNFNKGGENKSLMNSLYLFYNASISGTFVLMNGLKNKRVQRIVAGIAIAGALSDMLNRAMSGDDDDDGVKDYDDIPDYVLETNWVFMLPGSKEYVAIPMPYGFNLFHNFGRNLSNAFSGSPVHNPGKSAMSMAMTAVSAFNPMGGSNSLLNFISPTFADPFMDLVSNKDFAGNDIVPERPTFGVPVPESQKYWANTGDVPKWAAEQINRLTGGNEVRKGAVDVSPETLQYWFDYAVGATGKTATRAVMTGGNVVQGNFEDVKIGDIPFARRVVGSVENRGSTERYYENAQEVQTVAEELKLAEEQGNGEMYRSIVARSPAQVQLIKTFEEGEKALGDMRKQIRDLRDTDAVPADRKREMIKTIREQQDRLMSQLNQLYIRVTAGR